MGCKGFRLSKEYLSIFILWRQLSCGQGLIANLNL